ncbi:hypothetical protein ADP71_11840 [Vitreoscilla sp. C1]|nr:hypothetical protein ADP71_11840 [Vitreoscilla sp. C1]
MHLNHGFLLMCVSYILIMSSPAVKLPNISEWFGEVAAVPERNDRSVLNPNNFYRGEANVDNQTLFLHQQRYAQYGDAQAQYKLGMAYEHGLGVGVDVQQALAWYEKSAAQSFRAAQLRLAYAYYDGSLGLSANVLRAQDWFGEAGVPDWYPTRLSQMH